MQNKATQIAQGNPRLLERLNKVLLDEHTDKPAIIKAMESVEEKFREDVLIDKLLEQQGVEGRRLVACLAVCNIPVSLGAVKAFAGMLQVAG